MIFAVETDDRTFMVFPTEEEALAYCEGLDVEAAVWLFWNDHSEPLEPKFSVPNKRGLFVVQNGVYSLLPAGLEHHAKLDEAIDEVLTFKGPPPFDSPDGVRAYLRRSRGK